MLCWYMVLFSRCVGILQGLFCEAINIRQCALSITYYIVDVSNYINVWFAGDFLN
jgi:hypothetical protein